MIKWPKFYFDFILILGIKAKRSSVASTICSNVYYKVTDFEACRFIKNKKKSKYIEKILFSGQIKKLLIIH